MAQGIKKYFQNDHFVFLPLARFCRTNVLKECIYPELTLCAARSYINFPPQHNAKNPRFRFCQPL